jgi:ATP adenylyltransferase
MERLWSPWRSAYIESTKQDGCIFCEKPREDRDEENFILYRGKENFIIMNAFPYNPGHLMVIPYRHLGKLEDMSTTERIEHYELVNRSVKVLKEGLKTDNFNIGMNLGRTAGAGIDDHIHTHIVPRWNGDTNFMPVVGEVRVMSQALSDIYRKLAGKFQNTAL